jgi:hypothetical protein
VILDNFKDECWAVVAYPIGGGLRAAVEHFFTKEEAEKAARVYNDQELWVASVVHVPPPNRLR